MWYKKRMFKMNCTGYKKKIQETILVFQARDGDSLDKDDGRGHTEK